MIRFIFTAILLALCVLLVNLPHAVAQSSSTGTANDEAFEAAGVTCAEFDDEEACREIVCEEFKDEEEQQACLGNIQESQFVKGIRMEVFVKNASSFAKTLTVYDNECRRYLYTAKRFSAFKKERIKVCINEEGFGDVTVSRLAGSRKKRYKKSKIATPSSSPD